MSMQNNVQNLLSNIKQRDFSQVQGKFHSHITVAMDRSEDESAKIEGLRLWCRQRKIKLTVIDLSNQDRHQRDVMTTQHYRIEAYDAVQQITDQLIELCDGLEADGYKVLRVKLEHESLPTLARFSEAQYREVHIKLKISPEEYDHRFKMLKELGKVHNFVPSSNPNERKEEYVTQFVNMRIYDGDLANADTQISKVQDALNEHGFTIAQTKAETTIFDTNLELDRWWA